MVAKEKVCGSHFAKLVQTYLLGKDFSLGSKKKNAAQSGWNEKTENSLPLVTEVILQADRVRQDVATCHLLKVREFSTCNL